MKTEKFIKKWEEDRKKGKKRYVLISAIMMGIATGISYTIGRLAKGNFFDMFTEYYIYMHLAYFIGGFMGGTIGGIIRWQMNEEKYENLK